MLSIVKFSNICILSCSHDPIFIEEQRQLLERFKKMTVRNYIARTQLEKMYLDRDIARLEQMYLDIRMYYNIAQKLHYELNKMPEENNEHNRNRYYTNMIFQNKNLVQK